MNTVKPFTINIPENEINYLKERLSRTRFTNELPGVKNEYGVELSRVKELTEYWLNTYDWFSNQEKLNSYPQFSTTIDGQNIHFLHAKCGKSNSTPIIFTHGWPGSFIEFLPVIDRLVHPERFGNSDALPFDVIIPSLPGFGFSGPTKERGWDRVRIAKAWAALMARLGYSRYIAAGNDVGSFVSPELGQVDPEHAAGIHVTQIFSFPSGDPEEMAGLTPDEFSRLEYLQWWQNNMGAFSMLQSTQPQTLAHALADSPVGQLAWNLQLFGEELEKEFILTNVMIYWLTNTAASAARLYFEDSHSPNLSTTASTVPLGFAGFKGDFQSIRSFAERDHKNIVSWNEYDTGGHFAAVTVPEVYVNDIHKFAGIIEHKH